MPRDDRVASLAGGVAHGSTSREKKAVGRSPAVDERVTIRQIDDAGIRAVTRRPSFTSKEAEDVVAAVRFRLELEKSTLIYSLVGAVGSPPRSSTERDQDGGQAAGLALITDIYPGIHKSRLASARDSQSVMRKKKKMLGRPVPLVFDDRTPAPAPLEVQSATTTGEAPRPVTAGSAGSVEEDRSPLRRRRTVSDLRQDPLKTRRSRRQFHVYQKNIDVPPLPPLWTTRYDRCVGADGPGGPASCPSGAPLEVSATVEPVDTTPTSVPGSPRVPSESDASSTPGDLTQKRGESIKAVPQDTVTATVLPAPTLSKDLTADLKRKRSLFRWLHRRSELDELIEMYMDDQPVDASDRQETSSGPRLPAPWPMISATGLLQVGRDVGLT